jgi:hypothetical protein
MSLESIAARNIAGDSNKHRTIHARGRTCDHCGRPPVSRDHGRLTWWRGGWACGECIIGHEDAITIREMIMATAEAQSNMRAWETGV